MTSPSFPTTPKQESDPLQESIAIVGPCGAGKSTLAEGLVRRGYHARQIAQEHSYVPDMWQQLTKPDVLIFLEASFETCDQRKKLDWTQKDFNEQLRRLRHAYENCDICIKTDGLKPNQILKNVLQALP
jgi:adenylate kinase family enzyme